MGRGADSGRAIEDMLTFAHATRHEKIIRGLGLGVALIMYQQEEAAETVIEQLVRDKNPLIRYGGVFTVALAYCGSSNNKALQRLLHIAVSDVSDDVKRVAVIALGYVLMRDPDKVCWQVRSCISIKHAYRCANTGPRVGLAPQPQLQRPHALRRLLRGRHRVRGHIVAGRFALAQALAQRQSGLCSARGYDCRVHDCDARC